MPRIARSLALVALFGRPSLAGPVPSPSTTAETSRSTAAGAFSQARVDAAIARFRAGDFEAALTAFRDLEARAPAAQRLGLKWNIARCLEELGRAPEALAAFEQYRDEADTEARRARAEAKIKGIEAARFGRIAVRCAAPEVQVSLGDATRPCPAIFERVTPGPVILMARRGADEERTMHQVAAGETLTVELARPKVAAARPSTSEAADDGAGWWPWAVIGGVAVTGVVIGAVILTGGGDEPAPVYTFEFE